MFSRIYQSLSSIGSQISETFKSLVGRPQIDQATIDILRTILLQADVGRITTEHIIEQVHKAWTQNPTLSGSQLHTIVATQLHELLSATQPCADIPDIYIMVGVNGSGKTTASAKLARYLMNQGKHVTLVAADTFRAAAPEQLVTWSQTVGCGIVRCATGEDPAAVVYRATQLYKQNPHTFIVDTAGRLQTNSNLLNELSKIYRVIRKQLPDTRICTLLTVDSMLGQNTFEQAKEFATVVPLDGIILSKLDGSRKGGTVVRLVHELKLPVYFMSFGETLESCAPFDAQAFVEQLLKIT